MTLKEVRKGDAITARLWDALGAAIRANEVVSVLGGRIRNSPQGKTITLTGERPDWDSPHRCRLSGGVSSGFGDSQTSAVIRPGTINNLLPESGAEDFTLQFQLDFNEDGRAWIVANCRFDSQWAITGWDYQFSTKPFAGLAPGIGGYETLEDGSVSLPIMMLARLTDETTRQIQCVHFNQTHRARSQGAASGKTRHLFLAA